MIDDDSDILRYDLWIEDALRGVIRRSLMTIEEQGLPGDHHFYITFRTDHEDVGIADWLRAEYPEEMTIVVQHQFDSLSVGDDGFNIKLRFGGRPELLQVPFDAITSFADPSVSFGLQLKSVDLDDEDEEDELSPEELGIDPMARLNDRGPGTDEAPGEKKTGEVIALDTFRKK
ncbi:MAG: ClpXP protease specificity-enhancing factor SspB [Rhodospirillales bacterium]